MEPTVLWTTVIALIGCIYLYTRWRLNYWKRRGLESHDKLFTITMDLKNIVHDAYIKFRSKNLKHGGINIFLKSGYLPVDLDLLKVILLKNFDHFPNRDMYVNEEADPMTGHLFSLRDDKWKFLRTKLTPTFTTGKNKMMFQTLADCTHSMVEVLREISSPVDIREIVARFTTDVIGSVTFGIECNTMRDPDNEFRTFTKETLSGNWRSNMAFVIPEYILKPIGFRVNKREQEAFLTNTIKNVVDYREANNVYRKDFMHLMLQLKNRGKTVDDGKIMDNNKKQEFLKLSDITAQSFVFFLAGFETTSSLTSFTLFELSQHQDIQDKVRAEIKGAIKKHGGLTYEAIMDMPYLDQVVYESLRKYPSVFLTTRVCVKEFRVPDTNLVIEKGTPVAIPIFEIQHDPEYYPDPEKFDPDRFSPENKAARHQYAFLGFGEGPRICIGARYGLLQVKVGLTAILTNFKVKLNSKTLVPLEFLVSAFPILVVKGGLWLDVEELKE